MAPHQWQEVLRYQCRSNRVHSHDVQHRFRTNICNTFLGLDRKIVENASCNKHGVQGGNYAGSDCGFTNAGFIEKIECTDTNFGVGDVNLRPGPGMNVLDSSIGTKLTQEFGTNSSTRADDGDVGVRR